jgi:hypothetical protein
MSDAKTTTTDSLDDRYEMLLFATRRMVRYHRRRERFLDRVHHVGAFLTVVGGSATVATALGDMPRAVVWLAAFTAAASAHEIVFQTARRARLYSELARSWIAFEREVRLARPGLTEEALLKLQDQRLDIEADEPPALRVLDAICNDEMVRAMGYPDSERSNVTFWQRAFCQLVDYRADDIRKRVDAR